MQFTTNLYSHAVNQANVVIGIRNEHSPRGYRFRTRHTYTISGELLVDGVSAVCAEIDALQNSGYYPGLLTFAGLYDDDGNVTPHYIEDGPTCFGGIRIMSLDYPKGDATELVNGRIFQVVLEADFIDTTGGELQEFHQTVEYIGDGGPRRAVIETLTGSPVVQITNQRTIQIINQSGNAVGLTKYPESFVPAPIRPNAVDRPETRIAREFAREWKGNRQLMFPISWSYVMRF